MKEEFILTSHCQLQLHCATCRRSSAYGVKWRRDLRKAFELPDNEINFDCPFGARWDTVTGPHETWIQRWTPKPGKILTFIFKVLRLKEEDGCNCTEKSFNMDRWGWWLCFKRRKQIYKWIKDSYDKRKLDRNK